MKKIVLLSLIALTFAACNIKNSSTSEMLSVDETTTSTANELVVADNNKTEERGGAGIAARETEVPTEQPTDNQAEAETLPAQYENNGKVIELTDKTFNTLCIDTQTDEIMCPVPMIIDYNATWCGPCRQIAPILAKLQKEYGNKMQVFSVDIDKCQDAAQYFDFDAIPTLVFVDIEGNCNQITGSRDESEFRKLIKKHLKID